MPNLKSETVGTGDQTWLGSMHAVANAQSVALLKSAFTKNTHYPNGYIPSGLPISFNSSGYGVPYGTASSKGLAFVLTDRTVTDDDYVNVAALDHGRIITANLPISFTPGSDQEHFVFVPNVEDESESSSSSSSS